MKLRLILGDQLNLDHSWYKVKDQNTVYVIYELRQETDYILNQIQKIVAFFSDMRAVKTALKSKGEQEMYFDIGREI